jgi:hypothetical protein
MGTGPVTVRAADPAPRPGCWLHLALAFPPWPSQTGESRDAPLELEALALASESGILGPKEGETP